MNRGNGIAVAWQMFLEAGLLVVLPLVFYRPFTEQFGTPKIILTELLVTAGLAATAAAFVWRGGGAPRPHFVLPIAALAGAILLSCVNSPSPAFSLEQTRYFLCGPAWLLILVLAGGGAASLKHVATFVTCAGALVALLTLAQWTGHDPLLFGGFQIVHGAMVERMSLYSTFGNPNFVAGYLVGVAFLALALAVTAKSYSAKSLWFAFVAAILLTIVITQSHGAWAALVAGLLVWLWVCRARPALPDSANHASSVTQNSNLHSAKSVALLSPLVIWLATPMFSNLPERLIDQLAGRFYLWRVSGPLFAQHPLLGSGWGSLQLHFLELQAQFLTQHPDQISHWTNVSQLHNDPLQLLFEAGVLGLGAFMWLGWDYVKAVRAGFTSCGNPDRHLLAASAGGVAAILVDSLFNFQFAVPPTLILFFTLLAFPALLSPPEEVAGNKPQGLRSGGLRVLACVAALVCGAFLWMQTAQFAGAEMDYARGMRLEMTGDSALPAAGQAYRDGLALEPRNGLLHYGLSRVLYEQKKFPEALAEAEVAEQTCSDSHLEVLKGRIQDAMGQTSAALATYRHALALDPTLKILQAGIERLENNKSNNQ